MKIQRCPHLCWGWGRCSPRRPRSFCGFMAIVMLLLNYSSLFVAACNSAQLFSLLCCSLFSHISINTKSNILSWLSWNWKMKKKPHPVLKYPGYSNGIHILVINKWNWNSLATSGDVGPAAAALETAEITPKSSCHQGLLCKDEWGNKILEWAAMRIWIPPSAQKTPPKKKSAIMLFLFGFFFPKFWSSTLFHSSHFSKLSQACTEGKADTNVENLVLNSHFRSSPWSLQWVEKEFQVAKWDLEWSNGRDSDCWGSVWQEGWVCTNGALLLFKIRKSVWFGAWI